MKILFSIIVGTSVMLAGLTPAYGISLLSGRTQSATRWPYSFGERYIYDNAGSNWNYDNAHKHNGYRHHRSKRPANYRPLGFEYNHKRVSNEKFHRLIKHLSGHSFQHKRPFHSIRPFRPMRHFRHHPNRR